MHVEGDVRERIDRDQVNAIGGALSDSSVRGLYLHHTKVGLWLDGPMDDLEVRDNVIVDQIADGLNFHTGVTNSRASSEIKLMIGSPLAVRSYSGIWCAVS